jgi:hypothetical protein
MLLRRSIAIVLYIFNVCHLPTTKTSVKLIPCTSRDTVSHISLPTNRYAAESFSPLISSSHLIIESDNHVNCRVLYDCWPDDEPQGAGRWTHGAPTSFFRGQRSQRRSSGPRMILIRAGGASYGGIEAKNKSYPSGLLHRRGPRKSGEVGDVFVGR